MKHPTKETIAGVARYIAALHQDAHAHTMLATALQEFHDVLVQMTQATATDTLAYQELQFRLADIVTNIIDTNRIVTTANDELRSATLAYTICLENS